MALKHLLACTLVLATVTAMAQSRSSKNQSAPGKKSIKTTVAETQFKKAVEALQNRDFATAEPILKQATEDNPKNYQAWFYLGYVYNATNRRDDAIAAYRKAVTLQPGVLETNLNLGMLLAANGESEAGKYLLAASKLKPTPEQISLISRAWLMLGSRISGTDFAGAVDAYQRAAELDPKDVTALIELGQLLEKHGDSNGAEKAYKDALARSGGSSDAQALLASLYLRNNRLPEAEQLLRSYLQQNPQSANAHLELGRILRSEQKFDEAIAELEKSLELKPSDSDAMKELAAVQLESKRYGPAEATLKSLVAKNPNDAELHFLLGNTLLRQLKYGDAQAEYLQAVKLKPEWGEAYGELADAASSNKDHQLALRALERRSQLLPETPGTYFLRATCFDHLHGYEQAADYYHRFLSVSQGKFPDQEWQARHRLIAIEPEGSKKKK